MQWRWVLPGEGELQTVCVCVGVGGVCCMFAESIHCWGRGRFLQSYASCRSCGFICSKPPVALLPCHGDILLSALGWVESYMDSGGKWYCVGEPLLDFSTKKPTEATIHALCLSFKPASLGPGNTQVLNICVMNLNLSSSGQTSLTTV